MVNLLEKFSIRAGDAPIKLLKVIKNPVTDYLPPGCKKTLLSYKTENLIKTAVIAERAGDAPHCVGKNYRVGFLTCIRSLHYICKLEILVIGAMAKGSVDVDYCEESVSISNYPLSAALCAAKVCSAFEDQWGVH